MPPSRTRRGATSRGTKPKPAEEASTSELPPPHPPGAPKKYRARVRMYRQGLGDCFLLTFPRTKGPPCQVLIDCGVLDMPASEMKKVVQHIRDTVREEARIKAPKRALLDVVVGTHEHKDHLSGFNQARPIFEEEFDFRSVWLGWTENLGQPEISQIKKARKDAAKKLADALGAPLQPAAAEALTGVVEMMGFTADDDAPDSRTIADALEYLKHEGAKAGDLRFLEPGAGPLTLKGVDDVRVYALGPPRDPILLKSSEVTGRAKKEDVIYHLAGIGMAGVDSLCAALPADAITGAGSGDRYHPFSVEHRIPAEVRDMAGGEGLVPNPYFEVIQPFVEEMYDDPAQAWRRIDTDWLNGFGQLALDLDSDTNNTSLVLAFEFVKTGEVLLFVGDAQVGNWQSWAGVSFKVEGRDEPLPAHDLLNRTVFYKVGHHCSHNATLKKGGLELMMRDDLTAFIPLDRATARRKGKKDPKTGEPRGWEMPAPPLFKALEEKTRGRVVISDVTETVPPAAEEAGVLATALYIDYYLP